MVDDGGKKQSLAKQAAMQLAAGGSAGKSWTFFHTLETLGIYSTFSVFIPSGCVEVSIMHPLDLIKTRIQLQSNNLKPGDPNHYSGVGDCFKKMYKTEGIRSFWKGIFPPLCVETPKRAWKVILFRFIWS